MVGRGLSMGTDLEEVMEEWGQCQGPGSAAGLGAGKCREARGCAGSQWGSLGTKGEDTKTG